jgi:energy-coupling factor transporter ATP-binding protein EcfA2
MKRETAQEVVENRLRPDHIIDLQASGLSMATIAMSCCQSVDADEAKKCLGFDSGSGGLKIPYFIEGKEVYCHIKPDKPFVVEGKVCKYLSPKGKQNRLYIPRTLTVADLKDASKPIIITEGAKKAMKAVQEGFSCVALSGVNNWLTKGKDGTSHPIADLNLLSLSGRQVYIVFDSDAATNSNVRMAESELASCLIEMGASVLVGRLPQGKGGSKLGLDDFLVERGAAELHKVLDRAQLPEYRDESQNDQLLRIALEKCDLFIDQFDEPYASVDVGGHNETQPCGGSRFRRILTKAYYDRNGKMPEPNAVKTAVDMVSSIASISSKKIDLQNRVAEENDEIFIDLTDDLWRAIRVTHNGWCIDERPNPLFKRYSHQMPQVVPISGGDINELFSFIPISDPNEQLLMTAFLVTCFVPNIPHPVLILHGSQGSGKTTMLKMVRRLVDPSLLEVLLMRRREEELAQLMFHNWLCPFDNTSTLRPEISDAFCQAVTGAGFSKRKLYTDQDNVMFWFRRIICLNGINVPATRADLLDRSILLSLERINPQARTPEKEIWERFDSALPKILGGILDLLVLALKELPNVKLKSHSRMADFCDWGAAICIGLGKDPAEFQRAYAENSAKQNFEALQGSPIAIVLIKLMGMRNDSWQGSPSELLIELNAVALEMNMDIEKNRDWPNTSVWLTRRINEVKPNLMDIGIIVAEGRGRSILITRTENFTPLTGNSGRPTRVKPASKDSIAGKSPDQEIIDEDDDIEPKVDLWVASDQKGVDQNGQDHSGDTKEQE